MVFWKLKLKLTVQICVLALQSLDIGFILFPSSIKINPCISCYTEIGLFKYTKKSHHKLPNLSDTENSTALFLSSLPF